MHISVWGHRRCVDHFLKKTQKIDDADATLMNIEESLQVATSIHPSPK